VWKAGIAELSSKTQHDHNGSDPVPLISQVMASNTAAKYDIQLLSDKLNLLSQNFEQKLFITKKKRDTNFLHLRITKGNCLSSKDQQSPYFLLWNGINKDIYWFGNGVIVGWGITTIELASIESFTTIFNRKIRNSFYRRNGIYKRR